MVIWEFSKVDADLELGMLKTLLCNKGGQPPRPYHPIILERMSMCPENSHVESLAPKWWWWDGGEAGSRVSLHLFLSTTRGHSKKVTSWPFWLGDHKSQRRLSPEPALAGILISDFPTLNQWFSNPNVDQDHPEGFLTYRALVYTLEFLIQEVQEGPENLHV